MGLISTELGYATAASLGLEPSRPLEVHVLFIDASATPGALRTAVQPAYGLTAYIQLLLLETVLYPLPLDDPRRNLRFLKRQLRMPVDSCPVETTAAIPARGLSESVSKDIIHA